MSINDQLERLFQEWLERGMESEWHRLAKDFELPRECRLMLEFFEQATKALPPVDNNNTHAQAAAGKE